MNLKVKIKKILKELKLKPKKRFGQVFLIKESVFEKILKSAELKRNDVVIEIGPGFGFLTKRISEIVKKVIAIEKDKNLSKFLKKNLKDQKNIKIINDDILVFLENEKNLPKKYKVIGNIPYYLTSHLIRKFFEKKSKPRLIVLMVQKEVAKRILDKKRNSILSLSLQFFSKIELVSFVPKNYFWPKPKVDSAILKIIPKKRKNYFKDEDLFFKIVKAGFSHPRKKMLRNLEKELKLENEKVKSIFKKNNINYLKRAEELNFKDWLNILKEIKKII